MALPPVPLAKVAASAEPLSQGDDRLPIARATTQLDVVEHRRGRKRANGRLAAGAGGADQRSEYATQQRTLVEKGEYRRSRKVHEVAPSGTRNLDEAPDFLRDFGGDNETADAFEQQMLNWVDENLNEGGAEERTLDQKDRNVGLFGDFLEARQHGSFFEWVSEPTGYVLKSVMAGGEPLVAKPVMIMEYILKLAIGDGEACPKGGRPEYRNGPQYEQALGKQQGDRMREENKGECGWGAHKNESTRYTTIEQKVSNIRTWYDEELKNTSIANPARNPRIKRMLKSLEKRLGRTRKHVPEGLKKQILKDVLENIDLENTEETLMGAYMCDLTLVPGPNVRIVFKKSPTLFSVLTAAIVV